MSPDAPPSDHDRAACRWLFSTPFRPRAGGSAVKTCVRTLAYRADGSGVLTGLVSLLEFLCVARTPTPSAWMCCPVVLVAFGADVRSCGGARITPPREDLMSTLARTSPSPTPCTDSCMCLACAADASGYSQGNS